MYVASPTFTRRWDVRMPHHDESRREQLGEMLRAVEQEIIGIDLPLLAQVPVGERPGDDDARGAPPEVPVMPARHRHAEERERRQRGQREAVEQDARENGLDRV